MFIVVPLKGMSRSNEGMARMDDVLANETEEALSQFDFLGSDANEGAGEARTQGDGTEWGESYVSFD